MTLSVLETFGNGQEGSARDFSIGYFAGVKVLATADGGWIIVGKSDEGATQGQIVAQSFDASGEATTGKIAIFTGADAPDAGFYLADATLLASGRLAVSFGVNRGNPEFGSTPFDVYTRTFAAGSFAPASSLVQADAEGGAGRQYAGPITALADGGFALMWREADGPNSGQQVDDGNGGTYARQSDLYLRTFNANGSVRDQAYLAQGSSSPDLAFGQGDYGQDLVGLKGGGLVSLFSDSEYLSYPTDQGSATALFSGDSFHIATSTGAPAGVAEDASTSVFFAAPDGREVNLRGNVVAVATADGGFIAVYAEGQIIRGDYGSVAHQDYFLKARVFDANGAAVSAEVTVDYGRDLSLAANIAATALAGGGVAIAYQKSFANGDNDVQLVTLGADLSLTGAVRVAPGGSDNAFDLSQTADGDLLVAIGGGSVSRIVHVVDAAAGANVQSGSAAGETLTGTGVGDVLNGRGGADVVQGLGGDDRLHGGSGADRVVGGAGNDRLFGDLGNDVLEGGAGNDAITGGFGFDTVTYFNATGAVTVNLALSTAQNTGGAGVDTLKGIEHANGSDGFGDTLFGSSLRNILNGYGGDDTLRGGAGDDDLIGWFGDDVLDGGAGNDHLTGGSGVDTATYYYASAGVKVSLATAAAQNTGGAGVDTLTTIENLNGSTYADTLTGGNGPNVINGYGGNDIIRGGNGADTLIGGLGADTFVFGLITDSDGLERDRIADLGSTDKIDLRGIDANGAGPGNTAFVRLAGDGAFTGAGQLRLTSHGADTWLELNTDGDADAETVIILTGHHTEATAEDGWLL